MTTALNTPEALRTLSGFEPYLWQSRLLSDFIKGALPDALDVPTGLGKTAVMGIWLTARAMGAAVPRRLIYVVDRRAVVDQATSEAERLSTNLLEALSGGVSSETAEMWRRNLGLRGNILPISTLRGQFTDNRLWLADTAGSAIVVGTVDMVGSRMLFGGYGVSTNMRPVHAALIACDSLIVLDEAHLVPPFQDLVHAAVTSFPPPTPVPRSRLLTLSATGAAGRTQVAFRIAPGKESSEPRVAQRLHAPKLLRVHDTIDLAKSLADRAFELGSGGKRILVFCNSRDKLARIVAQDLRMRSGKVWKTAETTALLVGARRVAERELLTRNPVYKRFVPGEPEVATDVPAFLIATSAGEVGVDLDADHMVCDLVPWERMVQRLGRVNRTGRAESSFVDVFAAVPKEEAEDEANDRLDAWLAPFTSPVWPVSADGRRDAGPATLLHLRQDANFRTLTEAASTPQPLRPELNLAVLEAWAMTSLPEHTGRPTIEPWLRGWVNEVPQAKVVWRSCIPIRTAEGPDKEVLTEFFESFPPHLTEIVETEAFRVADLLKARATAFHKRTDKLVGSGPDPRLCAVVLDARGKLHDWLTLDQLMKADEEELAGKTIILHASLGGLSPDGLLDTKVTDAPPTLDGEESLTFDEARLKAVGRRLRIVAPDTPAVDGWVREAAWPATLDDSNEEPPKEWRIERILELRNEGDQARQRSAQALSEHTNWVSEEAMRIGQAFNLSPEFCRMLSAAAAAHDSGKSRELWQTAMGSQVEGRPYAKTDGRKANLKALGGYRHEFGSLRDAEPNLSVIAEEDLRELARHLIAAHHGWARPCITALDPADPPSLVTQRAQDVALRFARLQRQWGPWGLAWWECLLRAADWAASARPQQASTIGAAD